MPSDWNNVDLNSHEVESCLIDPLTFQALLLEVNCNLRVINAETIRQQFETDLQSRITEARAVFNANLDNIIMKATKDRNADEIDRFHGEEEDEDIQD